MLLAAPSGFSSLGLLEGASLTAGRPVSVRPAATNGNGTYPIPRMILKTNCRYDHRSNPSCDLRLPRTILSCDHRLHRTIPSCALRHRHRSRRRSLSCDLRRLHRSHHRGLNYAHRHKSLHRRCLNYGRHMNLDRGHTGHSLHRTIPNCGLRNREDVSPGRVAAARKAHAARYESPVARSGSRDCSSASSLDYAAQNHPTAAYCLPAACCLPGARSLPEACCLPKTGASASRLAFPSATAACPTRLRRRCRGPVARTSSSRDDHSVPSSTGP